MACLSLKIFISRFFFLSSVFVFSYGFKVIQPESQIVNPDQTASISCEHDSEGSKLRDVRLYRKRNNSERLLCQKGKLSCRNVAMQENPNKFVFTLQKVGPEAIHFTYQCEITVEKNYLDSTERGTPTKLSYDFNQIQPKIQDTDPDQTASISCEYEAAESTLQDVQLYRISQDNTEQMVCQKRADSCRNVAKYQENPSKFVFTLLKVGPEAVNFTYQCEIIVRINDVDYIERERPIKLQQGKELNPSSGSHQSNLTWILIGLLALMFLYSCVITCLYIRLTVTIWKNTRVCENSTYMVMKPPTQKSPYEDIYQMQMS